MGQRIRGVALVGVVLMVGAFLGSALDQWWQPDPAPAATGPPSAPVVRAPEERVRVEVLNGGGRAGMARAATDHLRELGFDVVYYGNAASFDRDSTVVLDRIGRSDLAGSVARALGVRRVRTEPDSNLYLDVSVVLGAEWEPEAAPTPEVEETVPAWWDLRRFFPSREEVEPEPSRMADPPGEGEGGERRDDGSDF